MRKIYNSICLLTLVLSISACNLHYEKTKTGLVYKVKHGKQKVKVNGGDFVKASLEFAIPERDTVLSTTYGKIPAYVMVDTSALANMHSFFELLQKAYVGDEFEFVMNIDSLKKLNLIQEYNNVLGRRDMIACKIKVWEVFKTQDEVMNDYQKEMDNERLREIQFIEQLLKDKKITALKTKSGAFVEIINQGNGLLADSGKSVTVNYTGRLMSNGKVFDSNTDPTFNHPEPFTFLVGSGSVIKGWDESLPFIKNGGKARVYIPAMMAYGAQGSPPTIPPYSNLVFEIEVKDVKDLGEPENAPQQK